MKKRYPLTLSGGLALALTSVSAETVFLRNGQYVTGTLIDQTKVTITVRTADGTITYPKTKVKRIVYAQTNEEEKKKLAEQQKARDEAQAKERAARDEADAQRKKQEEAERKRRDEEMKKAQEAQKETTGTTTASAYLDARLPLPPSVWRSVLLPGWGQDHSKQTFKSSIFSGATATMLLLLVYNRFEYQQQRRLYLSDSDSLLTTVAFAPDAVFPAAGSAAYGKTFKSRQLMEKYGNRTNLLATGIFLVWAANVVDIVWFRVSPGTSLIVNPRGSLSLGVRISY